MAVVAVMTAAGCALASAPQFYRPADVLSSGEPGDVLDERPIALDGIDGTGHRITYVSTTPAGDRIPVTGVVIVPPGDAPEGGWPVATWGHPTVGLADRCAPSLTEPFGFAGAEQMVEAGFLVVASDYEGLGIDELVHPYLVGQSEGRNVLDIARAARQFGGGDPLVAWGHSQGGHAVLWAREIVADYAPELELRGVAAAAPPTDLALFLDPGFTEQLILPITATAALAWATVYPNVNLSRLTFPSVAREAGAELDTCFDDLVAVSTEVTPGEVWRAHADSVRGWRQLTALNSADPVEGPVPVLISHGGDDDVVPLVGSERFVADLCRRGGAARLLTEPQWTHGTAYTDALATIVAWLTDRRQGEPAQGC